MLVWSRSGRIGAWLLFSLLFGVIYVLPVAVIAIASFAGQWNGVLPSHLTFAHYARAVHSSLSAELRVSLITGVMASAVALVVGTWAALALRKIYGASRLVLDIVFFIPSAVPSVSVGLGLLVAFSRPPILLNGTIAMVVVAHFVLTSAFTYGNVSAGLARLGPEFEQMAESLGARPGYRLRHVTLPLITPYLIAAFSLSFALSMGELGATMMVYPPGWRTLPVGIFALADRGDIFESATLTVLLACATLAVLVGLSYIPTRAASRR
ncbi:ABC transporter permease subunit [Acidiphilium sp. AL]|uniref:ABC transporter permease subunit n=1 Tax=Acidiphilium iwatense TaxID=768198 RepID=A0ABS9DZM4_9PROT|nr:MULTISPECIES: ABC transporter permease subunit [Acidiphilium]MCF3948214.1 ABC transporter permease subunit [Acidiphilium iwatense]MCU4161669.1 ABC transporter permease subunit [Acidiphilium sp. AL]